MGLIDKFKNMFTEEVEEEVEVENEQTARQNKVENDEIKSRQIEYQRSNPTSTIGSTPTRTSSNLNTDIDNILAKKYQSEEQPIIKHEEKTEVPVEEKPVLKREEKFVFPVYFDDKDFEKIEEKPKKIEEKKKVEKKEVYGTKIEKKETPKVFKPTPIISPIYGILDKNYHKEDITSKKVSHSEYHDPSKPLTIDEVRRKAYGNLDDNLETSLFTQSSIFMEPDMDQESKEESKNNLLTDLVEDNTYNNSDDVIKDAIASDYQGNQNVEDESQTEKSTIESVDDDEYNSVDEFLNSSIDDYNAKHKINDLNEDDFDLDDTIVSKKTLKDQEDDFDLDATLVNKKIKSKTKNKDEDLDNLLEDYIMNNNDENEENKNEEVEEDEDLTQSDLFNLIDSMYEKGEDE